MIKANEKIKQFFCCHEWSQVESHLRSVLKFKCVKCRKIGWWV